ncbi:hypothetical protein KCP73_17150 [Salmonella enterica subsp. enterica]|nr:hypothetical protein KCP73_17150 [Salmonella enterica subsp. enterica]
MASVMIRLAFIAGFQRHPATGMFAPLFTVPGSRSAHRLPPRSAAWPAHKMSDAAFTDPPRRKSSPALRSRRLPADQQNHIAQQLLERVQ